MCKVAALMITFLGSAHGFIRRSGKVNVECKKKTDHCTGCPVHW